MCIGKDVTITVVYRHITPKRYVTKGGVNESKNCETRLKLCLT